MLMKAPYVDFHCHPSLKPFGKSFKYSPQKQNELDRGRKNSIWHYSPPNFLERQVNQLLTLTKFTQTDFTALAKFNCDVVVISLYPFEKHFIKDRMLGFKFISDILVNLAAGISQKRIDYVRSHNSYFQDLTDEYQFYLQLHNQAQKIGDTFFTYRLVNSYADIERHMLESTERQKIINVVVSIEGAHALETGLNKDKDEADETIVLDNLNTIKQWEYPPFMMTLAHHFFNEICGHARSINIGLIKNQQNRGLNTGITNLGYKVIHGLLSTTNGKRILIDVKHMSVQSRIQYYELLDNEYTDQNIPIVVTHGAFNGRSSIKNPRIPSPKRSTRFNSSDINFFDSEIVKIAKSGGLFGLQLDERRIGSKSEIRSSRIYIPNKKRRLENKSLLLWNHIVHCAELLNDRDLNCWDLLCIGSDFDGIVNPIKGIWTSENIEDLRPYLIKRAEVYIEHHSSYLKPKNRIPASDVIHKFLTQNALDFLKRNFN